MHIKIRGISVPDSELDSTQEIILSEKDTDITLYRLQFLTGTSVTQNYEDWQRILAQAEPSDFDRLNFLFHLMYDIIEDGPVQTIDKNFYTTEILPAQALAILTGIDQISWPTDRDGRPVQTPTLKEYQQAVSKMPETNPRQLAWPTFTK